MMTEAFERFFANLYGWMDWNLFLAIIPLILSFILFAKRSPKQLPKNLIWWLGLAVFILFLPNAPYTLTDIIHFVYDARSPEISTNGLIFILIPQYLLFFLIGFQCHVLSILKLIQYLSWIKLIKNTTWIEISMNFICAIAVYWGRVNRLNSWDVVTQPLYLISNVISNLKNPNFFLGTIIFFTIFTSLYYFVKWINIAIVFYWQNHSKQVST